MRVIDELYTERPSTGSRMMTNKLRMRGYQVNRKRVLRLMRKMGIAGICPGPHTSKPAPEHPVFPYLLRGLDIDRPDQVWASDITYIPMARGFIYLVAVMDWHSRYVLSWEISNALDASFCTTALEWALLDGRPEIFNTDQGSQFTSRTFTSRLEQAGIRISMDGRGRFLDNIFIERLWRSVKYEEVYLNAYATVSAAIESLRSYFTYYNTDRPHSSLGARTPQEVYHERSAPP